MISWAISSKHENTPELHLENNTVEKGAGETNPAIEAAQCHSMLTGLLTRKYDPSLLHATLHGLLSSNHGRELDRLVSNSKLHAQTIHLIMRLDPFVPGVDMSNSLRELDSVRMTRASSNCGKTVQISEECIRHKEDPKYIGPARPFFDYHVADAHLYLMVALVSNNSLLGVSAVRAIWKMLTGEFFLDGL